MSKTPRGAKPARQQLLARASLARSWLGGLARELVPTAINVDRIAQGHEWQRDSVENWCARCGASTGPGEATSDGCPDCLTRRLPWQRAVRLSNYTPPVSEWIHAMKFSRAWAWGPFFGRQIATLLKPPVDGAPVVVVPIPLHWRRRWSRGYNQAALIAQAIAKTHGWPMLDLLRRTRHTYPQSSTPLSRKTSNVSGIFTADPVDLTGYEVWLVDDVKTSGATLREASRTLKKMCTPRRINIAVAAVADPKRQG